MSELAYDANGDAIELPAAAQWWRVRRFRNPGARGAPEVVIDKDGAPVVLSVEAGFVEFRDAVDAAAGKYRLDPLDDKRKVVPGVPAAYLTLNETPRNGNLSVDAGEGGEASIVRDMMRWNTELSRMQLDMAKGIAEKFSGMMQAAAELIRAADGAGIVARLPLTLPAVEESGEDEVEEIIEEEGPPSFAGLVAQVMPMLQMWLQVKQGKAAAAEVSEDKVTAEAAASAEATTSKAASGAREAKSGEPRKPRNGQDFTPTAAQMAHLMAIYQKLTPQEAALAQATAAKLSAEEQAELMAELAKLPIDEAVETIRSLLNGDGKAGGAS